MEHRTATATGTERVLGPVKVEQHACHMNEHEGRATDTGVATRGVVNVTRAEFRESRAGRGLAGGATSGTSSGSTQYLVAAEQSGPAAGTRATTTRPRVVRFPEHRPTTGPTWHMQHLKMH